MREQEFVRFNRHLVKRIKKLPIYIQEAVYIWIQSVYEHGLRQTRMLPGYHDEPLQGGRKGQRSIRLNRSYRLIYEETKNGKINFITILGVNKHEY